MERSANQPDPLRGFGVAAERVWEEYLKVGPSRVAPELFDDLVAAHQSMVESTSHRLSVQLASAAERLVVLSKQAVLRPEGLCFVTGEAGLLPRPDLHAEFERLLAAWPTGADS